MTCYYYRGAYYKAFWADPPSCTVGEPRAVYRGEAAFPLILQNVHRYFLYIALPFLLVLAHDVWKDALVPGPPRAASSSAIGVGTLVLADQRRPARQLHAELPFAAPSRAAASATSSRRSPVSA